MVSRTSIEPAAASAESPASGVVRTGLRHLAIIMDGNRRWARARGMPPVFGHQRGAEAVRRTVEACRKWEIQYLTLFAFSSENWKRPANEVNELMNLLRFYLRREINELARGGVQLCFLGEREVMADYVYVDGIGVGDVDHIVLRDRLHLATDGMVVIVLTVDKQTGKLIGRPDVVSRGVTGIEESQELLEGAREAVVNSLEGADHMSEWAAVNQTVKDAVASYLYSETHRRPMVLPVAVESLPYDSSVGRPSWGTLPELRDVVALARAGAITVEVEVFRLDEAIEAYRRLRAGEVSGRAVVVP